ncbi:MULTISPECIES: hypothetical protein [unclassified Roseobacter]|uniref:hypothetical protein n=1 Tax=unclassified Roseobacter TaxID=196798 RepID=UPI0014911100|nr:MULTISPECIES: hypothetical protein [unclassified Roseobacter]NNW55472.1 hypothetical protein [Roseobacter sp. HKCCD8284]NNY17287.1 hypothetical protein [Roseobacter sp. HKCCD8191]
MTDHPLDLRPHEVRASLDGRLSLIVRPLKPQPWNPERESDPDFEGWKSHEVFQNQCRRGMMSHVFGIGTTLWCREAWRVGAWHYNNATVALDYVDGPRKEWLEVDDIDQFHRLLNQSHENMRRAGVSLSDLGYRETLWRPSITLPRWASRLTLTVKGVDVKRVQEIGEKEAVEAGVTLCPHRRPDYRVELPTPNYLGADAVDANKARSCFKSLWNAAHGPDAWDRNPWCAFYSVTIHPTNIDMEG